MLKGLSIDLKSLDLTIDKFLCILIPARNFKEQFKIVLNQNTTLCNFFFLNVNSMMYYTYSAYVLIFLISLKKINCK